MVIKLVLTGLLGLFVCISAQRLGNECGHEETNRFLSTIDCTFYVRCSYYCKKGSQTVDRLVHRCPVARLEGGYKAIHECGELSKGCEGGSTVVERCPVMSYFNHRTKTCDLGTHQECIESSKTNTMRLLRKAYDVTAASPSNETKENSAKGMMVCYYTNWAQYRPGFGKYTPKAIDASLCSHFHYAFAKFNGDHTIAPYEWNDESTQWSKGMYEKFNDLKSSHPGLKTMLSLGGWNLASGPFSRMAASQQTRAVFIKSVIPFLRKWNFDGLGIDWEYPGSRGSPAGDKVKFTALVQETIAAFQQESELTNRPRLLLSAAVSAGKSTIDSAYEVDKVTSALDYIVVMTYDFFGAWNPYTGLVAPLYPPKNASGIDAVFNTDYAVKYWVSKGCPKDKLVVGVISYGRSFTLRSTSQTGLKAPANGAGTPGQYTREAGFLSYYEVCRMIKRGAKIVRLQDEKVPYLFLGNQWVTYEDKTSLTVKGDYINSGGYAGAAIWAAPLDDFQGNVCGEGPYPLLSTISKLVMKSP